MDTWARRHWVILGWAAGARIGTITRYTRKTQTKGRWGAELWQQGRNPKLMTSLLWPGLKYPSAIHLVFTVVSTFYTVQFSREVGRYIFWYSRILKTFFQYLISLSIMSFFDQFCSPLILHNFAPLLFHQLLHQNSIFFTMVNKFSIRLLTSTYTSP